MARSWGSPIAPSSCLCRDRTLAAQTCPPTSSPSSERPSSLCCQLRQLHFPAQFLGLPGGMRRTLAVRLAGCDSGTCSAAGPLRWRRGRNCASLAVGRWRRHSGGREAAKMRLLASLWGNREVSGPRSSCDKMRKTHLRPALSDQIWMKPKKMRRWTSRGRKPSNSRTISTTNRAARPQLRVGSCKCTSVLAVALGRCSLTWKRERNPDLDVQATARSTWGQMSFCR